MLINSGSLGPSKTGAQCALGTLLDAFHYTFVSFGIVPILLTYFPQSQLDWRSGWSFCSELFVGVPFRGIACVPSSENTARSAFGSFFVRTLPALLEWKGRRNLDGFPLRRLVRSHAACIVNALVEASL